MEGFVVLHEALNSINVENKMSLSSNLFMKRRTTKLNVLCLR
jgi:hypothetical protein